MNEKPLCIYAVSLRYPPTNTTYPAAAFPTRELAEAYVRYSKANLSGALDCEHTIAEHHYYDIDFEWARKINEEARNK